MERLTDDSMKSSKTMRELAKALALKKGLRAPEKGQEGYVGYALTISMVKELYLREGFPVNSKRGIKTMDTHIEMWILSHTAYRNGDLIYFALDPDSYGEVEARQAVYSLIKGRGDEAQHLYDISEMLNGWGLEA